VLEKAARESNCDVLGFHQMSLADISLRTSLPVRQAALAKQREYDEPFEILGSGAHMLLAAIERLGKRWTRATASITSLAQTTRLWLLRTSASFIGVRLGPWRQSAWATGTTMRSFSRRLTFPSSFDPDSPSR